MSSNDSPTEVQIVPSPRKNRNIARLYIVSAAVMWSTSGFFAKAPLWDDWPVEIRGPLLAFWRALFAAIVLLPLVRRPRWTWRLIPMVLIFAAMNYTYLSALVRTTPANAIWLQNTAPIWVFLIGVFFFSEPAHRRDWWVLLFCCLGIGLILLFELQGQEFSGVLYGVFGGLFYGATLLAIRQLRDQDSAWLIAINHIVTAMIFAPYVIYYDVWPSGQQWGYLVCFGMFQMGLPYFFFARGLRSVVGHEAAGIVLLEPILVPIWVYLAWHNEPSYLAPQWWTYAGGGLILTGLMLRYVRIPRKSSDLKQE